MLQIISISLGVLLLLVPVATSIRLIVKGQSSILVWAWWTVIGAVLCYLVLMAGVFATNAHLMAVRDSFDLDGDGVFSGLEITPESEEAMRAVSSDTGRTLAPFTGLFTCPIYSAFWHALLGLGYFCVRRVRMKSRQGEQGVPPKSDRAGG